MYDRDTALCNFPLIARHRWYCNVFIYRLLRKPTNRANPASGATQGECTLRFEVMGGRADSQERALCAIAEHYRVNAQAEVLASVDWKLRVSASDDFLHFRGWIWCAALQERAHALSGSPELSLWGYAADIAFARSVEEVRWARGIFSKCEDPEW